ncbi:hypothetical protein EQW76_00710 [Rhizobium sp. rho-13.1]|uniref:hypothetical protein n=1 Tax=Rhizobium sp. rho-13.1 TaxID=2506431 RepID=UPI00115E2EAF|nr:hypothetical protein [Rhizobium sp. rho-13.1]TQX91293.1 hypothetical protein EQW76_00710 [Rhizobium sp. rho-13.1]
MNVLEAYATPCVGGYHGMVRYSHKAQAWPVMRGEQPIVFKVESAAIIAAQDQLIRHINGTLRSSGFKMDAAKASAEKLFTRQRGSSKTTAIEIKRRGA